MGRVPAIHDARALRNSLPRPASSVAEPMAAVHLPSGEQGWPSQHGIFPLLTTGNVFDRAADVEHGGGVDGVLGNHVGDADGGAAWGGRWQRSKMRDAQLVYRHPVQFERLVSRMVKTERERRPAPHAL